MAEVVITSSECFLCEVERSSLLKTERQDAQSDAAVGAIRAGIDRAPVGDSAVPCSKRVRLKTSRAAQRRSQYPLTSAILDDDTVAEAAARQRYLALDESREERAVFCITCRNLLIHIGVGFWRCPYELAGKHALAVRATIPTKAAHFLVPGGVSRLDAGDDGLEPVDDRDGSPRCAQSKPATGRAINADRDAGRVAAPHFHWWRRS